MQTCGVCDLPSDVVGALEAVHANVEINGQLRKVSQFVCSHCKPELNVEDNSKQDD